MKRNYVWAAALLMLAACSNEDVLTTTDNPDRGNEGQRVTVTATLPGNDSRLALQEATENGKNIIKVAWNESGEAFTVMTTAKQQVTSEVDDGGILFTQTAGDQFTGTLPTAVSGQPYYAIYPALDMCYIDGEGNVSYNYWDDQGYAINSFSATQVPFNLSWQNGTLEDTSMPLMYATSTDGEQFDFHHLTAIVKFTLTGLPEPEAADELVGIDIEWKGGCGLYGTFDLTQSAVTEMYPTVQDEAVNYLPISTNIEDGTATFYAYLPPIAQGKTLDISFSVVGEDNVYECTAQVELAKAIEAGMYYRATREVTTTAISRNMTAGNAQELQAWLDNRQKYYVSFNLTLTGDITLTDADDLDGDPENQSNWPAEVDLYGETIDGDGHTLTGLKMDVTGENASMFHRIDGQSVVKNLHLRNVQLSSSGYYAAGVVANNEGTVSGCSVSGTIMGTANYRCGGVVGANSGTVTACYSSAAVSATNDCAGGVVGDNQGTVTACYSTGAVSADEDSGYAGGVAGTNSGYGLVEACYWSGTETMSHGIGFDNVISEPAPSNEGATRVNEYVDWNSIAMGAMNDALPTDFGWKYIITPDSNTSEAFPLILEKTSW